MKKLSIFLAAMAIAISAGAQSETPAPAAKAKSDRTTWIVRAGMGVTGVDIDDDMIFVHNDRFFKAGGTIKPLVNYSIDFGFNRKMGNKGAYWGMEWGLGNRGYQIENGEFERKLVTQHFHLSPFIFGWKIKCGQSKISIDPHLAVYLAADYYGKVEEEGLTRLDKDENANDGWGTDFANNRSRVREYDEEWSIRKEKDYMPFDAGLKLGVGVWFNDRWNVDLSYHRGLIPAYVWDNMDYDDGAFTNKLVLRVGFGF